MSPTWIGIAIVILCSLLLIRGGVMSMFAVLLGSALMGGSSAINLPALGGSSIPPSYLVLGFLTLRLALSGDHIANEVRIAVRENLPMVIFCVYGAVTALILSRIFTNAMEVVPLRPTPTANIYATEPLVYTSQNLTTAIYLAGSLVACLLTSIVARARGSSTTILKLLVGLTWAHVAFGLLSMLLISSGQEDVIDIVRNGAYAQLTNDYKGFVRVTGFFPEASSYANFGIPLMVLMVETWLRNLLPRWTGPAALAMSFILLISTSSTAYVGLGAYGFILLARSLLLPNTLSADKAIKMVVFVFLATGAGLLTAVASPQVLHGLVDMVQHMTVDKADSTSGLQRRFWAEQGLAAFKVSWGLGVGAGSFRSSSIATAIIGSMGVIGVGSYLAYLLTVLKLERLSTYGRATGPDWFATSLGGACAIAAVMDLASSIVIAPSPVPTLLFTVLAALAIAFRPKRQAAPVVASSTAASRGPARTTNVIHAKQTGESWGH